MKDKIFIVWSGSDKVAQKVKKVLENNYNYICFVGGHFEGDTQMLTVGDTILRQMRSCNQAIVLFTNKSGGSVSSNLFFELGFATATYGLKKVHCVKRKGDAIQLPSDFDNSFVEEMDGNNDDEVTQNIVNYFISRQKLSIDTNKMYLINNRYIIHEMIQAHYSDAGSKCSDYELAQYILFYMQAGVMYQDDRRILDELVNFKKNHNMDFSNEVRMSVNISISLLEIQTKLVSANNAVYINEDVFRGYFAKMKDIITEIAEDDSGTFDEWARVIAAENLTYVCTLYASNPKTDEKMRTFLFKKVKEYGTQGLKYITDLERITPCIENNDNVGLIAMFRAYIYRHLFLAAKFEQDENCGDWLNKTIHETKLLIRNFDNSSIDTKIYKNFEMEYFVNLLEWIIFKGKDNIDEFDYMMYLSEIDNLISKLSETENVHAFIKKIVGQRECLA